MSRHGLRIGKAGKRVFRLPLDIAGEAVAILAKRGAGKTNTATVIVEELFRAGVQVVILDPVGAWWGVRSKADGESAGLKIPILGGQHGDVPLEETAGDLIADVVVDTGSSMLLDLSDFASKAAMNRFATAFAKRLYFRKGRSKTPLHVVLEEADQFCPQSKSRGEEQLVGAYERMVRLGRSRGIGITMVTQRSAKLNKDILTQADWLVAMRTTGPTDKRAVKLWIDSRPEEAEVMQSLPDLKPGQAWFWGTDTLELVSVRLRDTYDSSSTPKVGQKRTEPTAPAAIDLDALGEQIASTVEKAKANDPKELRRELTGARRRIERLEEQIGENAEPDEAAIEAAHRGGQQVAIVAFERVNRRMRTHVDGIRTAAQLLTEATRSLTEATHAIDELLDKDIDTGEGAMSSGRPHERPRRSAPTRRGGGHGDVGRSVAPSPEEMNGKLPKAQQRIINALATYEGFDVTEPARAAVGAVAGYKATGGYFANSVSSLASAGLVTYPRDGHIALTPEGRGRSARVEIRDLEELHAAWLGLAKGSAQRAILVVLIAEWPQPVSRDELGRRAGYDAGGGYFANSVSALKTLGAIEYPTKGFCIASDLLFPEGLQ